MESLKINLVKDLKNICIGGQSINQRNTVEKNFAIRETLGQCVTFPSTKVRG